MSTLQIDSLSNVIGTKSAPTADLVDGRCTAWCRVQASAGIVDDSFNILSCTYETGGVTLVTLATPMANTNYVVVATSQRSGGGSAIVQELQTDLFARTTSQFKILNSFDTGTTTVAAWSGTAYTNIAIFGGK